MNTSGKQKNEGLNPGTAEQPDAHAARAPSGVEEALTAALAHHRAGRLDEAEALYRTILLTEPNQADALNLLGVAVQQKGDAERAVGLIQKAIAADGTKAIYYTNLGHALHATGRLDEAVAVYRQGLALDPHSATIHNALGNALQALGRVEEAMACYRRALDIDPDYLSALSNLGNVLQKLGRLDEAVASYGKALLIQPDFATALANLGNVLHIQGKLDEAEECLRRAVEIKPDFAMARSNLGILLKARGRHEEAEESLKRAVAIDPDDALARGNLARLLLLLGDFGRAWEHYAVRQTVRNSRRALWQKPLPDDLRGKLLFVLKDQGLGDEIFFLRFAPELKRRGAEIAYLANAKIGSIIARLPFIDRVLGEGEEPEGVDISLSVGDLPLSTDMKSAADIPPPLPLAPEPKRVQRLAAELKKLGPAPYIGATWRAGVRNRLGTVFKVAPLEGLAEVLSGVAGTFLALQRKPEAGEIAALSQKIGRPVHDFTALNEDLEDMLALLSLMDEYVTVSNTNVQLRAGAGRTSRVLVPNPPEYRWMAEGEESPWFPGCKVYRQMMDGDWDEALAALARDLKEAFRDRGAWQGKKATTL